MKKGYEGLANLQATSISIRVFSLTENLFDEGSANSWESTPPFEYVSDVRKNAKPKEYGFINTEKNTQSQF